jgi:microcompartment protein CcmL/EutN
MELTAIGMIETSSIAAGIEAQDAMLKAADVRLIVARTICSGKYIVVTAGDVAAVRASVDAGVETAAGVLVEQLVIPNVHPSVFPALGQAVPLDPARVEALGILETFSAASVIEAADAAAKAAEVVLFRVHVAMAIGGKGFLLLTGDVAATEAAIAAGAAVAAERGMVVNRVVIPRPVPEVFQDYI